MTQILDNFEPLTEQQRYAYLQAMDITLWVPKDQDDIILEIPAEFKKQTDSAPQSKQAVAQQPAENLSGDQAADTSFIEPQESGEQYQAAVSTDTAIEAIADEVAQTMVSSTAIEAQNIAPIEQSTTSSNYLKLVNWQSQPSGDKKLLVICRHQKDQPAQSFARPNAPSQFMQDYLQTINELVTSRGLNLQIQLAHLTEAGLGSDNLPMEKTLSQIAPDLILLLGDEGIRHLYSQDSQVADYRGRLLDIKQLEAPANSKAVASYHPYSLIQNPALKKLAFEDLAFLVSVINSLEQ